VQLARDGLRVYIGSLAVTGKSLYLYLSIGTCQSDCLVMSFLFRLGC
jgi:hypothetical protein